MILMLSHRIRAVRVSESYPECVNKMKKRRERKNIYRLTRPFGNRVSLTFRVLCFHSVRLLFFD